MKLTKRQQQKADTKNRIVEAAYTVYAKQGFTATTNDIAKQIDVSHGTIFAHFPTKDDLLIYLIEDFGERTNARLHELTEESTEIKDVLNAHLNAVFEQENFYTKLISERNLLPAKVRSTFIGIQSTIAFHMEQMIKKEKAAQSIKNVPDYFIFNLWIGLLHYYLQNKDMFSPESSVIQRYREDFVNNFLEMLRI